MSGVKRAWKRTNKSRKAIAEERRERMQKLLKQRSVTVFVSGWMPANLSSFAELKR